MKVSWTGGDPEFHTPNDTLIVGRFHLHFCGPWDHGGPLRVHMSWWKPGQACSYCGSDWVEGKCSKPCKPRPGTMFNGKPYEPHPLEGRLGWHFAFALTPGARFAHRIDDATPRWTNWGTR